MSQYKILYCDSGLGTLGARLGVLGTQAGAGRRWGAQVGMQGAQVARRAAAGRHGAGARSARGARQQAQQGRAGLATWALGARPVRTWVCSAGPGWGFVHSDSVFGPVGLSTVPESLNEHCSLQNNF